LSDFRQLLRELEEAGSAWLPKGPKAVPFWKQKGHPGSKQHDKKQASKGYKKGSGIWSPSDYNKPEPKQMAPENHKVTAEFGDMGGEVSDHRSRSNLLVLQVPADKKRELKTFLDKWKYKQERPAKVNAKFAMVFIDKYVWEGPLPAYKKKEKWISAGGVVLNSIDDYKHVWIFKPSNNYGPWSFPKGRVDEGESKTRTAVREVREETGLRAQILNGGYLGVYEGGFSKTHFWLMVRTGGSPAQAGHEAEKVQLVSWTDAFKRFQQAGNRRDTKVIKKALDVLEGLTLAHKKRGK
jgi:8-oxo-dGTP pyrophosphatase MutT (NUDIX family)